MTLPYMPATQTELVMIAESGSRPTEMHKLKILHIHGQLQLWLLEERKN